MAKRRGRLDFYASDSLHNDYARQLRSIASEIGRIADRLTVSGLTPIDMVRQLDAVTGAMNTYSALIEPWAEATAARMLAGVNAGNIRAWRAVSTRIGREISGGGSAANALVADLLRLRILDNVTLIKSIPVKAGERIARIVQVGFNEGRRAEYMAADIAKTSGVSRARAEVIARTEVSKASTALTQIRAESYGSRGYTWRTSEDDAVRPSHAEMEGKFVAWDAPPTLDGMTGHAGEFPNCRCYTEVVMPGAMMDGRKVWEGEAA